MGIIWNDMGGPLQEITNGQLEIWWNEEPDEEALEAKILKHMQKNSSLPPNKIHFTLFEYTPPNRIFYDFYFGELIPNKEF